MIKTQIILTHDKYFLTTSTYSEKPLSKFLGILLLDQRLYASYLGTSLR